MRSLLLFVAILLGGCGGELAEPKRATPADDCARLAGEFEPCGGDLAGTSWKAFATCAAGTSSLPIPSCPGERLLGLGEASGTLLFSAGGELEGNFDVLSSVTERAPGSCPEAAPGERPADGCWFMAVGPCRENGDACECPTPPESLLPWSELNWAIESPGNLSLGHNGPRFPYCVRDNTLVIRIEPGAGTIVLRAP